MADLRRPWHEKGLWGNGREIKRRDGSFIEVPLPFFREQNRSGVVMYSHAGPVSFPFSFFPGDPKYPKNPKSEFENFSLRINIFGKPILAAGSGGSESMIEGNLNVMKLIHQIKTILES